MTDKEAERFLRAHYRQKRSREHRKYLLRLRHADRLDERIAWMEDQLSLLKELRAERDALKYDSCSIA